jgi:hypothetical protein
MGEGRSHHELYEWIHGFPTWGEALLWIAWIGFCLGAVLLLLKRGQRE